MSRFATERAARPARVPFAGTLRATLIDNWAPVSYPGDPNAPGGPAANPYQAPVADLVQPYVAPPGPPEQLARAPKVFGVLSIVFASIVMLVGLLGLLAGAAASVMGSAGELTAGAEGGNDDLQKAKLFMGPMVDVYRGISYQSIILTLMSIVLLVIGIGQVRYRKWARSWSVYWGGAALACVAAMIAISMLIITPAYSEMFAGLARMAPNQRGVASASMGNGFMGMMGGSLAVFTVIFYAPYPLLLLFFFSRDNVRAAMTR